MVDALIVLTFTHVHKECIILVDVQSVCVVLVDIEDQGLHLHKSILVNVWLIIVIVIHVFIIPIPLSLLLRSILIGIKECISL